MRIHQITETIQQYHGGNNYHFTIPHTGNNSHTFDNYNSTRYGVFFTNNPKFAKLYGEPKKFVLNIKNTLDLDNPDSQKILNHFYKIAQRLNDRELFLNIQHILNYGPYWQLFEDDIGKLFTKFLKKYNYDSAKFTDTNTDDNDKEITSNTIVVLDTNKIRQDKDNQPDLFDDEPIKLIKENNITINQLLNQFKKEYQQSIEYGCKRNNCGIPATDLELYAKKYNLNVPRISGYFIADKPQLSIKDFTPTEIQSMKKQNLNPNNKKDRYTFAKQNNLLDELKYIPHYWNTYNNQIIYLTAHKQFIDTNIATDTNPNRYTTNNPYIKK